MELKYGHIYFISDDFFKKVNDPYLKINYEKTSRPHYFGIKDPTTSLYWLAPLSSKIDKFEKIIHKQEQKNKPSHGIKIIEIRNKKIAVLFQDMFPVAPHYIKSEYIKNGQPYFVSNHKKLEELQQSAKVAKSLLQHGVRFTPTQPDIKRIEKIMLEELHPEKAPAEKMSMKDRMTAAKEEADHRNNKVTSPDKQIKTKEER